MLRKIRQSLVNYKFSVFFKQLVAETTNKVVKKEPSQESHLFTEKKLENLPAKAYKKSIDPKALESEVKKINERFKQSPYG